ncbi:MAG: hypothetical protein P1U59_03105 [Alcanivorax sp.]|uniref:hypothetical protein n=1 Tax=Alcanivorax sp. TaxID=1872427 RepID=UPI00261E6AF9|nr:hypothetical protein [Alcanivorax sp.]MDF1723477.1 hypothetical protein [Alcanivorax sp.]
MDIKSLALLGSTVLLAVVALVWGLKFIKRKNYLLGFENLVVSVSSTNLLIYLLFEFEPSFGITMFLDAFSRAAGIPIIGMVGLMAVTHHYRPSKMVDALFFVGGFAWTAALVSFDVFAKPLPYYYVVMWTVFSVYLIYFAFRLLRVGETRHAITVFLAMATSQTIAVIYDFFPIPGDPDQIIFYTLALTTWSFMSLVIYYAYFALQRAEAGHLAVGRPHNRVSPLA